jgi:hypothetical protein
MPEAGLPGDNDHRGPCGCAGLAALGQFAFVPASVSLARRITA